MRWSRRLLWEQEENALARAAGELRGRPLLDLTVTNPTVVGLTFEGPDLASLLAAAANAAYEPSPGGLPAAREALAADLGRRGTSVPADRIVLTASSSEAYGFLFKLLADPEDVVLVPTPSYPLFAYLARLEGVVPVSYRFVAAGLGWELDRDSVVDALAQVAREGRRVAAVVAVSPNNPTGHWLSEDERLFLAERAAAVGAALIVDEVFQDCPLGTPTLTPGQRCAASVDAPTLTFSLGGLSKSLALPHLKVGWILVGGPDAAAAVRSLELIADTYLSVTTASQVILPALLAAGDARRARITARLHENRASAALILAGAPISPWPVEAGWSQLFRFPAIHASERATDEAGALAALEAGVSIHPGFFFDLPSGPFLVASLLSDPAIWRAGWMRLRHLADPVDCA